MRRSREPAICGISDIVTRILSPIPSLQPLFAVNIRIHFIPISSSSPFHFPKHALPQQLTNILHIRTVGPTPNPLLRRDPPPFLSKQKRTNKTLIFIQLKHETLYITPLRHPILPKSRKKKKPLTQKFN